MRVVLDTNVLVSALLKRDSVPGRILAAVWSGSLELVVCDSLLEELRGVLAYPKIRRRLEPLGVDVAQFLDLLQFFTSRVETAGVKTPMPRDAADQHVLATLIASEADWLITGDEDLLALADRFAILSPAAFTDRFLR